MIYYTNEKGYKCVWILITPFKGKLMLFIACILPFYNLSYLIWLQHNLYWTYVCYRIRKIGKPTKITKTNRNILINKRVKIAQARNRINILH